MKTKSDSKLSKILKNSEFSSYSGIILVIVVVCIFMTFRSSNFMTTNNILNILRQISVYGILACGMAFAMMTGGIDLTVGATAGVAGAIAALMITNGTNMVFAIVVAFRRCYGMAGRYYNCAYGHSTIYYDSWTSDYIQRSLLSGM